MSGYIKYFDAGGKYMSFLTDDKEVYEKYNEIWNVVKKLLKLKFTVSPVRDDKYIIAKLKIFNEINRTTFTNNVIPIEKNHICISAIDIDSVLKIENRAYPQAYLEQCKYKLKKRKPVNFIDFEIIDESDDESDDKFQFIISLFSTIKTIQDKKINNTIVPYVTTIKVMTKTITTIVTKNGQI